MDDDLQAAPLADAGGVVDPPEPAPPPLPQYVADPPAEFRVRVPRWGYIADMRDKLKALIKPLYGTKDVLWKRLQQAE